MIRSLFFTLQVTFKQFKIFTTVCKTGSCVREHRCLAHQVTSFLKSQSFCLACKCRSMKSAANFRAPFNSRFVSASPRMGTLHFVAERVSSVPFSIRDRLSWNQSSLLGVHTPIFSPLSSYLLDVGHQDFSHGAPTFSSEMSLLTIST